MSNFSFAFHPLKCGMVVAQILATSALILTATCPANAAEVVPDFYASGFGWQHAPNASGKNFDPPPPGAPGAAGPIGAHPNHPHVGNGTPGQAATPRIGNDGSPLLLPWAAENMKKTRLAIEAGGVPFDPAARCWPGGVPAVVSFANQPMEILQTPDLVVLLYERGQVARRIYMNRPHAQNLTPTWYGESVGHYENGDTLVIDTIGMTDKSFVDVFNVPHTKALHIIERYKIIDGGNKIELVITVDDPQTFTQTWSVMKLMEPSRERVGEVLCQVGNDDVYNQGLRPVPTAATPDY